jgi:hypothetical protein
LYSFKHSLEQAKIGNGMLSSRSRRLIASLNITHTTSQWTKYSEAFLTLQDR